MVLNVWFVDVFKAHVDQFTHRDPPFGDARGTCSNPDPQNLKTRA